MYIDMYVSWHFDVSYSLYAGKILAVAVTMMSVVALFIVENIYGEWKLIVAHVVPTYWAEVALRRRLSADVIESLP